ncbi:hypothetical protein QWZ08_04195 [Ferruginibacter paludis]|uniref:hypothetical protein n=1 Tax=Ferruginibacter paludis TaxID=1310417 RepID=UPI0025B29BC5|nr:hypothetical protein [Ferruginibacter paludis]MDN3654815.1 hypothetical protein [Ferruginibacter paludis]
MLPKDKYELFTAEYYRQEIFSDVVTKRKISKHISDINDTITEDDIKNVKTNFGNASTLDAHQLEMKKANNN